MTRGYLYCVTFGVKLSLAASKKPFGKVNYPERYYNITLSSEGISVPVCIMNVHM